jgi:hypothetical protein
MRAQNTEGIAMITTNYRFNLFHCHCGVGLLACPYERSSHAGTDSISSTVIVGQASRPAHASAARTPLQIPSPVMRR